MLATAAAAQDGLRAEVTAIDGRILSGIVTTTASELRVMPADGAAVDLPLDSVLAIAAAPGAIERPRQAAFGVWLRSGGVLPATRVGGGAAGGATVSVDTASGATLELPMATIAALRTRANAPATFDQDRAEPDDNRDYLYIVKGGQPQRFTVTVNELGSGKLRFALRGADYDFPLQGEDSVAAVVFGRNRGFAPDDAGAPHATVELSGGERCSGRLLALGDRLSLQLDEGPQLEVASSRVVRIDMASDRLLWLSQMTPKVEQTAAFDRIWPWTVDASPAGPGIHLGGREYARGLEMVPRTRLTYDLGGRYDLFEATIGIDDRGGPQAHAILRVLGDGAVLYESPAVVLRSPPIAVHVELNRCRELTIEADFGKNFDLGDLCVFADARVLQR